MKIGLTGASGFVGQALIRVLRDAGHEVKALQNRVPISQHVGVDIIKGGLSEDAALASLVQGCDTVIHCAALVAARSNDQFFDINTKATSKLVEASRDAGVKRFLLVSSLAAREPNLSAYAKSKYEAEQVLRAHAGEMRWDALRPTAVYGPGDVQMLTVFKMIKAGFALMPAGADARVSLVYIDDLVAAIMCWLKADEATNQIYEISGPEQGGQSWVSVLNKIAQHMHLSPKLIRPPRWGLKFVGHFAQLWGALRARAVFISPGKINEMCHSDWACHDSAFQKRFDWQPSIDFDEGSERTLAWYKQQNHL